MLLLVVGATVAGLAAGLVPRRAGDAAAQAWPAFVLVLGLLLIGFAAAEDGAFAAGAALLARLRGGRWVAYLVSMGLVAVTSVLLNLDTAVAFLTPVVVLLAREHDTDERPFLYGCVLMANSASLLLPGSNLTNLIVLRQEHVSGLTFAARIWPAWLVAVAVTAALPPLLLRGLRDSDSPGVQERKRRTPGLSLVAIACSAVVMLVLADPALPVLAIGVVVVVGVVARGRSTLPKLASTMDVTALVGLFGLAVGTGSLARAWTAPTRWLTHVGRWPTALLGATAAVAINNLPAAMLMSAQAPVHPRALLLGLDIGPNIAVTGSLSALLWMQAAGTVGSRPSVRLYTLIGSPIAALAIPLALLAIRLP